MDNDNNSGNLAVSGTSAWWYSKYLWSDFNRQYSGHSGRMYWAAVSGEISKSIMMIKRNY